MKIRKLGSYFFVLLLALCGCRARMAATTEDAAPEDTTTHLGDRIDISLADWLQLPRAEQAQLVEEWTETVARQRAFARSHVESVQLLSQLHPPVVTAVFAEATFSPPVGFSLPPYLKARQKDVAVALHLARFGDGEAALQLADPNDKELLAKIDAYRGERNYPLEWTRLAALLLQNAELKLANGEPEGATALVLLHRQLRSLLDAKSAPSALGAALLPRGREALRLAASAWRQPRWNKTALAADIDAALADWGAAPPPVPGFSAGAKRSEVVALMGSDVQGRAVLAQTPLAVQRTLDLLALPLPSEGADCVAAFLDDKQILTDVLVLYRPKINDLFPEPRQLALPLVEQDLPSADPESSPGLRRQSWTGGGLTYEVTVLSRGIIGGALVRVGMSGEWRVASGETKDNSPLATRHSPLATRHSLRDFGAVHLDRSFAQNRLGLAPDQFGTILEIKDAALLAHITQPATKCPFAAAVLQREPNTDLLARLTLRWPADRNSNALRQLALPLWAAYGPTLLESAEEVSGGLFTLTWQDETTRLKLHLPFEDKAPELVVEDNRGPDALKRRVEAAAAFDRQERQQRLAAGKPQQRLARFLQLPSHGIDDLRLGMTREQVQAVLPGARSLRVMALSDGLHILILNEPPARTTGETPVPPYWPRQFFVRFGDDNRVAEIRVRYQEGLHAAGAKAPSLLDKLRSKTNGVPEILPAPWAQLWTDLPTRKPPVFYRWRDDVTCLTYQRDAGGSEVTLRDCPPDKPQGVELPPLRFCGRGVEGCVLDDAQPEVRRRWQIRKPLLASNGAEVLMMPSNSPYDVLLVWYENDRVSKLIARHRNPQTLRAKDVAAALQKVWGADLDRLGFVRRQDGVRGQVLRAYSYHDDRTRVRLFAQETRDGIRLFTEWRQWPIAAPTVAAK